ncbi:MAG: methylmalonyl-CoA mutase family protein [Chloroflexota bacterium]|nr:methylmalonyl-CoA mutase family protein [Chloroflexota bacterium]
MAKDNLEEIEGRRKDWEETTLKKSIGRYGLQQSPTSFYTPLNTKDHVFLDKVGFPGEYPYTAGTYASTVFPLMRLRARGQAEAVDVRRAGMYSGYGTSEDCRDFYKAMQSRGWSGGPNIAFDLPTQCGFDSDSAMASGEVGRVGVAIDTLRDMEVLYEAFTGERDLDKIGSNFTINPTANITLGMYFVLAEKRGISSDKLVGTPQNDILKEFVARGTYIFPVKESMRMTRDSIVYCVQHAPGINPVSISGYHIREAGASAAQALAFTLANGIAYFQLGVDAGLDVDSFAGQMTFLSLGGSMDFFREIAVRRAERRMWSKIMKERFGAKKPKSWIQRQPGVLFLASSTTAQRPLNNLTRGVVGAMASAMAGFAPLVAPPYDEPLGLGWSLEAQQLSEDAMRILICEAGVADVMDPFAGSYFMETLTDQIEEEAWDILNKIDEMGGAVAAIEQGFYQREIAKSAYGFQHGVETGEKVIVGVNAFLGENELEVETSRLVAHPYDPTKREEAEQRQLDNLAKVKRERDNEAVKASLKRLKEAAEDESVNIIPAIMECVKLYASEGEMVETLKEVFGEYKAYGTM